MPIDEIYLSVVRSSGDLAGIFEFDGENGYFYLYGCKEEEGKRILGAIRVYSSLQGITENDLKICWDFEETKVGIFIRGVLWAVFDGSNFRKYGGNYRELEQPHIPSQIANCFRTVD